MRILILSRKNALYSTRRLQDVAQARGHEVSVVDPLDFSLVVSRARPSLYLRGTSVSGVDVVIPRIGASITSYGLAVVRQFDMMGVAVLNHAIAIARSRDKLRAMQLLTRKDLDIPTTVCAKSSAHLDTALSLVGGPPAIVKLHQGTQGIGVMLAETRQSVESTLEAFWTLGEDIILQEFIAESRGRDLRAIVVGRRVVAAMRRRAQRGEFRSNLHRGGEPEPVPLDALDPRYARAAIEATRVMGLEVAGVDLLETRSGPKILEINSSPGLEGIERATGVDVAVAIVRHAERFLRKRLKRSKGQGDTTEAERVLRRRA
ncbi:MAG: 30S ribosomal protein S6--L-glutamate ligase [Deltaproteobacteria bacterium]|nr:30S ribosomal protein S6--L-glutamate ligase [Deltaproteobacteria bacterium]